MLSHTNTFSYTWFSLTTPTYFQSLPLCFSANGSNLLRNNKHHGVFNDGYYQWPCGKCQINIAMAVFVSVVLDKRSVPLHRGLCRMFASLPRSLLIIFNLWRKNTALHPLLLLGSELSRPLGRSSGSRSISPSSISMNKPEHFTEMLTISAELSPHCAICGIQ